MRHCSHCSWYPKSFEFTSINYNWTCFKKYILIKGKRIQIFLSNNTEPQFINIDDTQVTKLISNQFSNGISLEKEEIDKLIDFSSFQSKYSQNDIKEFSEKLNSALEKLKNQNMGGDRPSSSKGGKDKSSKKSADSVTLFEFLINGLIGLFNPKDSFLFLIGFFVLVYFGLKGLRKLFIRKNTNNNKKRKKQE